MMQSLIAQGKRLGQKVHQLSPKPVQKFFSKVQSSFVRFGKMLAYMRSEVLKHLPEWRQDIEEYRPVSYTHLTLPTTGSV